MSKLAVALVLCDVVAHGLKAGNLVEAEPSTIKALVADGSLDSHKDAVAAARERGADVQRSSIELAAEARQAQLDALRVEIAKAQELAGKADDDATRNALEIEARRLQVQLDELLAA